MSKNMQLATKDYGKTELQLNHLDYGDKRFEVVILSFSTGGSILRERERRLYKTRLGADKRFMGLKYREDFVDSPESKHNHECPRCQTIGGWKKATKREEKVMPNGETISFIPILGVECPKCGLLFEPRVHDKLRGKIAGVFG